MDQYARTVYRYDLTNDDTYFNKIQNKCKLDIEMDAYIKQARIEFDKLSDVKERLIVQQRVIQQQLDDIQMLIRKQSKQLRKIIQDHLERINCGQGYSNCESSEYQQYKNQILDGFNNLSPMQIYSNLNSNLEWVSSRIKSMHNRAEQNFSQYFKNVEVYQPNRDFFACMISYDFARMDFSGQVLAASISNDQKLLICSSEDRQLGIWDLFNFCEIKRCSVSFPIISLCFSKYDNLVYLASWFSLEVMHLTNFNITEITSIHDHIIVMIEKDQNVLITRGKDQTIRITNLQKKREQIIIQNKNSSNSQLNNIDYSKLYDIIVGSSQSQILLWNAQNGKQVAYFDTDFNQMINQTYFSQKQDKIVAISFESNQVNVYSYDNPNRRLIIFNKYIVGSNLNSISWTQQDQILTCALSNQICFVPVQGQNQIQSKSKYRYVNIGYPIPQFVQQPDNLRNLFCITKGEMLTILEQQYQEELISYEQDYEQIN